MDSNPLFIILGAFLAFLATLSSDYIKGRQTSSDKRRALKKYLIHEAKAIQNILGSIKISYEHQSFYDFNLLEILDGTVVRLENIRPEMYLLKDDEVQDRLFDLSTKLALLAKDLRGTQNYAYNLEITDQKTMQKRALSKKERADHDKLVDKKHVSHMVDIVEMTRTIDDLARLLD